MRKWAGRFEWDEVNLAHAARHGVTPLVLEAVALNEPKLFTNEGLGRTGSHLLIGPDEDGRFWSIVLLEQAGDIWRPITGWPSTGREVRRYRGEE